ncbi:MAG: hypothetical protein Kow0040_01440 [Thermogutta sp.]
MARRVLDRKALREQAEAAEKSKELMGEGGEEKPAAKKPAAKTPRKSRAKAAKTYKLVAVWGVFNQTMVQVQTFDYSRRADAEKAAQELTESKKVPHFVQLVKQQVEVES